MFKIADGREHFYQWDLDRQVIVDDSSIVEVHFCNRTDDCSLVVEVVDGLANVPNILLQNSFDIRVFGYDGKATRYDKVFKVKPRTQPSDYMYTETIIKSVDEIMIAAEQVGTITNEFYEFVDEYKMGLIDDGQGNVELKAVEKGEGGEDADLSNYYTKEETELLIEEAVEGVEIPEEYVTEAELEGYATEEYVDKAIADIDIPEDTDLSGYYTKEEVDTTLYDMYEATVVYRLVKPDSDPTPDSTDGNKVLITDEHTIEYLNRLFNGEAVLGYTWPVPITGLTLGRYLITDSTKAAISNRLTLKAHRLFVSSIYHYIFYMDLEDDGNWYWAGYTIDEYDIQEATEKTVQTALNNIGVAEGGAY